MWRRFAKTGEAYFPGEQPAATAPPPSTLNSPPSTPSPGAASRLSLGSIKKKAPDGKAAKTYPRYPADQTTIEVADWLLEHIPFEKQLETTKPELATAVTEFYFESAHGRDPESSVIVPGTKGELMVVFPKQLVGAVTDEALRPLLGGRVESWFRQKVAIKVDGDLIPAAGAQTLIAELIELFARHGASDALSATENWVPLDVFHLQRHRELDVAQNVALNSVARIKTSVKIRK